MSVADESFSTAVAEWIDNHAWPRPQSNSKDLEEPQSNAITVINGGWFPQVSFRLHSAFNYFEIEAVYIISSTTLTNLQIQLVTPGKSEATTLIVADSYPLSTNEGQPLKFNLNDGYVHGHLSFKLGNHGGKQNISVTYSAHLPFAGDVEDTLDIAPTWADSAIDFTAEQLKAIPTSAVSELKLLEEKARSGRVVIRAPNQEMIAQQALLVKFMDDFVIPNEDSVFVETYYAPGTHASTLGTSDGSMQWKGTISFLGVLELDGSIDPTSFTISATLYARIPIAGRVRLTGIEGSLLGAGASIDIDVKFMTGKATFTVSQNSSGKHDLYVDASATIKLYGKVNTDGKLKLFTLPF